MKPRNFPDRKKIRLYDLLVRQGKTPGFIRPVRDIRFRMGKEARSAHLT